MPRLNLRPFDLCCNFQPFVLSSLSRFFLLHLIEEHFVLLLDIFHMAMKLSQQVLDRQVPVERQERP